MYVQIWTNALDLCLQHFPEDVEDVSAILTSRFIKLGQYAASAEMHSLLNDTKAIS